MQPLPLHTSSLFSMSLNADTVDIENLTKYVHSFLNSSIVTIKDPRCA